MLNEQQFKSLTQRFAGNENPESKRSAAMYGMMSELSGSGSLKDMVSDFLDKLYKPDKNN